MDETWGMTDTYIPLSWISDALFCIKNTGINNSQSRLKNSETPNTVTFGVQKPLFLTGYNEDRCKRGTDAKTYDTHIMVRGSHRGIQYTRYVSPAMLSLSTYFKNALKPDV